MRIYVDTNVYLDMLEGRAGIEPFDEYALSVFRRVVEGEFEIVVSDHLLWQLNSFVRDKELVPQSSATCALSSSRRPLHPSDWQRE